MNNRTFGKSFIIISLIAIAYTIAPKPYLFAFIMENQNLRLELPDVLGEKVTEQEPSKKDQNSTIIGGFPGSPNNPFSFSTSLLVDFGIISPTDPVIRTTNLLVQKGAAVNGYDVIAFEDHPLRSEASPLKMTTGDEINDTSCDSGSCSNILASPWSNPLVFGSGFRVDNIQGSSAYAAFQDKENFMRFAKLEASEAAIPVMSKQKNDEAFKNDEIRLTQKVNIPQTQKAGLYQNIIYYVAVPNF